jgi:hypothetical protein
MSLETEYVTYIVTMKDPDTLEKHEFEYLAEDANDAYQYAAHDHPEYDVVSFRRK